MCPDAYEVFEGRYINYVVITSAADALNAALPAVPRGVVRTILGAHLTASVSETRYFWFSVMDPGGNFLMPVSLPINQLITPAVNQHFPFLKEGMEIKLFPGEVFYGFRSAATAGSTMTLAVRYIDAQLPIYEQYEPQVRRAQIKRRSDGQKISSGGGGSTGGEGGEAGPPPGGPGESIPGY